jgi:sec-independent protein translocase protein TatA
MPIPGGWELVILIGILVLLFGAKRLPDMARSIGQSARVFKGEMKGMKSDEAKSETPADPPASPAPPPVPPPALPQAQSQAQSQAQPQDKPADPAATRTSQPGSGSPAQ